MIIYLEQMKWFVLQVFVIFTICKETSIPPMLMVASTFQMSIPMAQALSAPYSAISPPISELPETSRIKYFKS
jgi:hypothetical protein